MKYPVQKKFIVFSVLFFLFISLVTFVVYIISSRQINRTYIEQQLRIASETIRLRLAASVNSELALVLKMANTPIISRYFMNPHDKTLEAMAHIEFDTYLEHFSHKVVFWINDIDKIFYSTDTDSYVLDPDDPESYWYNLTLYNTEKYNFNINYNPDIQRIYLWVNVPVFDDSEFIDGKFIGGKKPIGMLGTGIDLTVFSNFIANAYNEFDKNITPFTYNKFYEITSASDYNLVHNKARIDDILGEAGTEIARISSSIQGEERLTFAYGDKIYMVSSIPDMEWFLAVSHPLPGFFAVNQAMNTLFFSMLFLILIILIIINMYVSRSVKTIADQNIQLFDANVKAQAANQTKSNFLATMSHEIRTPINTIIGITQIRMMDDNLPDNYINDYEMINISGNNLLGIINDILDMSKIETGKLNLNPVEYDLPSLINDIVQLNIVRIGSKSIEFNLNIDKNLPLMLYGDELRIKQILNNLLSNAIKYTEEGHIEICVSYESNASYEPYVFYESNKESETIDEEIQIIFSVKDTGQGISAEDKEKLFSEYSRFNEKVNRTIEGTGLGLNITKRIVELMNGTINVESEYGKGSTFTVRIPQKIIGTEKIGEELASRLSDYKFISNKQINNRITREPMPYGKVLIVDDVEANIYVAKGLMMPYHLQITTVDNGYTAIDLIKQGELFDIIFMDHMMPGIDGVETTKQIRNLGYTAPIVALTANAVLGQAEIFMQNGFDEFISKPLDMRHLDNVLNKFIRDKQPQEVIDAARKNYVDTPDIKNEKSEDIKLKLLERKIEGLDIAKGLKKFKGDVDFYLKLLHIYSTGIHSKFDIIKNTDKNNLTNYKISVHGIKGTSLDIFALKIGEDAALLEKAAASGDIAFINENNAQFLEALNSLVANIDDVLADFRREQNDSNEKSEKPKKDKPDETLLLNLLDECNKHYLDGAETIMTQIEEYQYDEDDGLVKWLREKIDMIKFEDVVQKILSLNIKNNSKGVNL